MNKAQPDNIKIKNFCAAGLEVRENLNSHSLFGPCLGPTVLQTLYSPP